MFTTSKPEFAHSPSVGLTTAIVLAHPAAPKPPQALIRSGYKNDSERWRGLFLGALHRDERPVELHAALVSGIENEAWKMLYRRGGLKQGGLKFRSFNQFCRTPAPDGLGREPDEVHQFLRDLFGERGAALAVVDPAMRGVPRDRDPRTGQAGRNSERHDGRLRAVAERAPEVVRRLYELKVIGLDAASKFGVENPTERRQQETLRFVAAVEPIFIALGNAPDAAAIKVAKQHVRRLLPVEPKKGFDQLLDQFSLLPRDEQAKFLTAARDRFERESLSAAE